MTLSFHRRIRRAARGTPSFVGAGALAVVLLTACGSGGSSQRSVDVSAPAGGYGADTAERAVIQFLDAAQTEDYSGMWAVFGTAEGAAIERFGVQETESRMVVLSRLLKHEDYELRRADLAGLGPNRVRWEVRMQGTRQGNVVVPFVTAHDDRGRWYVEQLAADRLSGGGLN